jgi:hypothetical protein
MSSARLRPIARESGTIGVEQNSPIFTPGVANRAVSAATARSHAATSWQPAALAMPPIRDHRLRELVDQLHQLRAELEQPLEERHVAIDHLAQVVARAERGAVGLDHDRARVADALQRGDQLLHQLGAEGVALVGTVQGHAHGRPVFADQHRRAAGERAHDPDDRTRAAAPEGGRA